jgi:hypothetical protein
MLQCFYAVLRNTKKRQIQHPRNIKHFLGVLSFHISKAERLSNYNPWCEIICKVLISIFAAFEGDLEIE